MGDVAMTIPVLKNALDQNPGLRITVVSNAFFEPLFTGLDRCTFYPAFTREKHAGFKGMLRLFRELVKQGNVDAIADFHGVLRSSLLRFFFKMAGYKTAVIDKGRAGKAALTRKKNKIVSQQPTTYERYARVLRSLNVHITLHSGNPVYPKQTLPGSIGPLFQESIKIIGVAPFAQHKEKMYPLEKMKAVVQQLSGTSRVILFGGGSREIAILKMWVSEMPNTMSAAGNFTFAEELAIISNLSVMISMDSANMHLASLYNVPVVSIWGATHPYAGFYGWNQPESNIVSIDLFCRPCSVFGNKPCWRGDHACMERIKVSDIVSKIQSLQ